MRLALFITEGQRQRVRTRIIRRFFATMFVLFAAYLAAVAAGYLLG